MLQGHPWPFFFYYYSIENNMEEEKLALGHVQDICLSFDLLTSSFLRIRINEINCPSVMGRGAVKSWHLEDKTADF